MDRIIGDLPCRERTVRQGLLKSGEGEGFMCLYSPSPPYKTGMFYDVYFDQSLFSVLLTKAIVLELFYLKPSVD